jgi:DNA mismatch repair ATPase MutS
MSFPSILFDRPEEYIDELDAPGFFVDLNLDQIVATITAGKDEYNLKPFFNFSLNRTDAIEYRHEVMQDLENPTLLECVKSFAQKMHAIRERLAQADKLYYKYQKESWFLDAVELYCNAIACFADDLFNAALKSRGFLAFRKYLADYACSARFTSLLANAKKLKDDFSRVRYCVLIKGGSFQVRKYEFESDYSVDVEETFEKFKQGAVKDYRVKFSNRVEMNHIEAKILDFAAQLHPDTFSSLDDYCTKNGDFLDEAVAVFDREIQFYVAYLEYISKLKCAGLKFCYPRVSNKSKEICNYEGFDLALANKLTGENSSIVCNDFYMRDKERIFVVTGPNQGGKTTFARAFGQLHYLAGIGCPVPGREAQLFLFDRLFTHFEREEDIKNLRGKLHDDLVRIHDIINQATPNSIIIMNEIFTSTTLQDAVFLSKKIMKEITRFDSLCVWVTFIDELAYFGEQVVSMVSTIVPENPTLRTFKILRRPADGLSYAMSLAEKYRLTYKSLKERV